MKPFSIYFVFTYYPNVDLYVDIVMLTTACVKPSSFFISFSKQSQNCVLKRLQCLNLCQVGFVINPKKTLSIRIFIKHMDLTEALQMTKSDKICHKNCENLCRHKCIENSWMRIFLRNLHCNRTVCFWTHSQRVLFLQMQTHSKLLLSFAKTLLLLYKNVFINI